MVDGELAKLQHEQEWLQSAIIFNAPFFHIHGSKAYRKEFSGKGSNETGITNFTSLNLPCPIIQATLLMSQNHGPRYDKPQSEADTNVISDLLQ